MNLYLKYRPKLIAELDLAGVRGIFEQMIEANKVAHAYLLTGPRGAGKTSAARVLARMVNCEANAKKLGEPCNECSACRSILEGSSVDVIEIDAASNRGIDDIRELKEKIRLSPASLRKKVYIIDEVHMLTLEAFNALLKTLEEPPSHSVFILCTTELHKVPQTIVSRCTQVQFTKATSAEMQRSLNRVVKGEGITAEEGALEYLSLAVDGSFRDGVKVLDQVISSTGHLKLADLEGVVSGSAGYKVGALLEALTLRQASESLQLLSQAVAQGVDLNYLLLSLMRGLRDKLLVGEAELGVSKLIFTLDDVARRLASSLDGQLLIQVAIVEWCGGEEGAAGRRVGESFDRAQDRSANQRISESADPSTELRTGRRVGKSFDRAQDRSASQKVDESEKKELNKTESLEDTIQTTEAGDVWKQVIGSLGQNNMVLDTILSKAQPGKIRGDELTLYVAYDFHRQQLMTERNLVKLESLISKAVGRDIRVFCEVNGDLIAGEGKREKDPILADDIIDEAVAIFSS